MSKALDIADEMATHLKTLPQLAGIEVIVDRQKDIANAVLQAVEKSKGAAVVILYIGGRNLEDVGSSGGYRKRLSYGVSIHTVPVLRGAGDVPNDELVETVERAMNGWLPSSKKLPCYEAMQVRDDELIPDKHLLIYSISMDLEIQL